MCHKIMNVFIYRDKMQCRNMLTNYLFGVLLMWTTFSITSTEGKKTTEDHHTMSLMSLVSSFIQPFIQSIQYEPKRPMVNAQVRQAIEEVIDRLRPNLQDDGEESDEETSSINLDFKQKPGSLREKNVLDTEQKSNINIYEKSKSQIKTILENELVSRKSKKIILKTLDELIDKFVRNRCRQNASQSRATIKSNYQERAREWIEIGELINKTKHEWAVYEKTNITYPNVTALNTMFTELIDLLAKLENILVNYGKNKKLVCQIVDIDQYNNQGAHRKHNRYVHDICDEFQICSEELRAFLNDFYENLADTTISVFKSYGEMYKRDVIADNVADSEESDSVPRVMQNIPEAVEKRVTTVFVHGLKNLKLDKAKRKRVNVNNMRSYVRHIKNQVIKDINRHLKEELALLSVKLQMSVIQDLKLNLQVDLDNLGQQTILNICKDFGSCNSKVSGSRKMMPEQPDIDMNSVRVKLQLRIDNRLKNALITKAAFRARNSEMRKKSKANYKLKGYSRSHNLTVTRTTLQVSTALSYDLKDDNTLKRKSTSNNYRTVKHNVVKDKTSNTTVGIIKTTSMRMNNTRNTLKRKSTSNNNRTVKHNVVKDKTSNTTVGIIKTTSVRMNNTRNTLKRNSTSNNDRTAKDNLMKGKPKNMTVLSLKPLARP